MPVYHQMGNDSENLVFESELSSYRGAVLSPVNSDREELLKQVAKMRGLKDFEIIFDPQLYSPKSEMGKLPGWSYFPKDVDTADLSSDTWWNKVVVDLVRSGLELRPHAICSPAMVPRSFPDGYFNTLVGIGDHLDAQLRGSGIEAIQTAVIAMKDLIEKGRSLAIASVLTRSRSNRFYLVFVSDREPRRELADSEELKGAMRLISALRDAGAQVLVGFCSSDVILWKFAGAAFCATGKFFNLRRFTLTRFAEPSAGGGQLPYWFEESLLGFLRQSDLLRVQQRSLLSNVSIANPIAAKIFDAIPAKKPWLGLSWRQYMWWFAEIEKKLDLTPELAKDLIQQADENWGTLEKSPKLYMEERPNDGSWLRQWLRVLEELPFFE